MAHVEIPNSLNQTYIGDFKSICRICLEKGKELQSIFQYRDKFNERKKVDLSLKIKKVSTIVIHPNDKLPDKICVRCVDLLLIAHYFKTLSEYSDAKLRNILNMDVITHGKIKLEVLDEWEHEVVDDWEHEIKLENDVTGTIFEGNDLNYESNDNKTTGNMMRIGESNVLTHSTKDNITNKPINDTTEKKGKKCNIKDLDDKYCMKTEKLSMDDIYDIDDIFDSDISSNADETLERDGIMKKHAKRISQVKNKIQMLKQKIQPLREKITEERRVETREVSNLGGGLELKKKTLPLNKRYEKRLQVLHDTNIQNKVNNDIKKQMPLLFKIVTKKIPPVVAQVEEPEIYDKSSGCYECLICGLTCNQNSLLQRHMAIYHKEKKELEYECYGCDLKFKTKSERSAHMAEHTVSQYRCKECNIICPTRHSYRIHMAQHAPPSSDTWEINVLLKCADCDYVTPKTSLLNSHIKWKHKMAGKDYVCETCGRHYANYNTFQSHKMLHRPPSRVFKCTYCDYTTRYSTAIKTHERTHVKDYRFTCELCGKNFITSSALNVHRNRHNGIKNHHCKLCNKNYISKNQLRCHIESVHDKIRPYKCSVCSAAFYRREKCRRHMRNVHKIASPNVPSIVQRRKYPY